MMKYGYIRVSTAEQNLSRQYEIMKQFGIDKEHIYAEKISGKNTDRPELQKVLSILKKDDWLYVESYSRLARNTRDLLTITDQLSEKGINFFSAKEQIDTSTPQGKLMLTFFAGLSQFERECTLERQREGIELAKQQGKYKGRQPVQRPSNFVSVYQRWQGCELSAVEAMKILGLKKTTFYKMVKEYEREMIDNQLGK